MHVGLEIAWDSQRKFNSQVLLSWKNASLVPGVACNVEIQAPSSAAFLRQNSLSTFQKLNIDKLDGDSYTGRLKHRKSDYAFFSEIGNCVNYVVSLDPSQEGNLVIASNFTSAVFEPAAARPPPSLWKAELYPQGDQVLLDCLSIGIHTSGRVLELRYRELADSLVQEMMESDEQLTVSLGGPTERPVTLSLMNGSRSRPTFATPPAGINIPSIETPGDGESIFSRVTVILVPEELSAPEVKYINEVAERVNKLTKSEVGLIMVPSILMNYDPKEQPMELETGSQATEGALQDTQAVLEVQEAESSLAANITNLNAKVDVVIVSDFIFTSARASEFVYEHMAELTKSGTLVVPTRETIEICESFDRIGTSTITFPSPFKCNIQDDEWVLNLFGSGDMIMGLDVLITKSDVKVEEVMAITPSPLCTYDIQSSADTVSLERAFDDLATKYIAEYGDTVLGRKELMAKVTSALSG